MDPKMKAQFVQALEMQRATMHEMRTIVVAKKQANRELGWPGTVDKLIELAGLVATMEATVATWDE